MQDSERWVVTSSGDRPLRELLPELATAGFSIDPDGVLAEIGCIVGTADADAVERVRAIPGVIDVSPPPRAGIC